MSKYCKLKRKKNSDFQVKIFAIVAGTDYNNSFLLAKIQNYYKQQACLCR